MSVNKGRYYCAGKAD